MVGRVVDCFDEGAGVRISWGWFCWMKVGVGLLDESRRGFVGSSAGACDLGGGLAGGQGGCVMVRL